MHPRLTKPRYPQGGWHMGIPKATPNKQASLDYAKWFFSKDTQKQYALNGGLPTRVSAFTDPEVVKINPHFPATVEGLKNVVPGLSSRFYGIPPEYVELEGIVTTWVTDALEGRKSVKEALDRAAAEMDDLMAKREYPDP
jgi:multiple sugar transport system substrate-binding protein